MARLLYRVRVSTLLLLLLFGFVFCDEDDNHECVRLCDENSPPKRCLYRFVIGISRRENDYLTGGLFLTVNGRKSGAMISVCQNDTIVVDVNNKLPFGIETALHWYGFTQDNSPYMDGVPMVTQCPIAPHTSFRYQLKASKPGTFFYRSHSVAQQLDGILGPLIVRSANGHVHPSQTILISPVMKKFQTLESSYEADLNVSAVRFEVYNDSGYKVKEADGQPQLLRIINAAAINCPLTIFTHTVPLKLVAIDANDIKPKLVHDITINPGERLDFVIKKEIMKVTHIIGHELCHSQTKFGLDAGLSQKNVEFKGEKYRFNDSDEEVFEPKVAKPLEERDFDIFLPFDATVYADFKGSVDFRYILGALTPYAPTFLTKNLISVFQIHNKSFLYPPSPILSQSDDVPGDILCNLDNPSHRCKSQNNGYCECVQILNLPYGKNIDLFLVDEGKNGNTSQSVHIHGYSFFILSKKSYDTPINVKEIEKYEKQGRIQRNLINPIKKDTVIVPNKGYVVVRLHTNNPGTWLIESTTSTAKTKTGVEIILAVDDPLSKASPPTQFPKCGSMKEPDRILSND